MRCHLTGNKSCSVQVILAGGGDSGYDEELTCERAVFAAGVCHWLDGGMIVDSTEMGETEWIICDNA